MITIGSVTGQHGWITAGFSFSDTLLMLPWVFFVVGYAQGSAQIGGEVKRASRTQYFAMVGGVLINGLVLAVIVLLATHAGAGGVLALGTLLVLFIVNKSISTEFAVTAHLSVEFMLGVIATGILWYAGALWYNRRRGVNLNLAYKEISPE